MIKKKKTTNTKRKDSDNSSFGNKIAIMIDFCHLESGIMEVFHDCLDLHSPHNFFEVLVGVHFVIDLSQKHNKERIFDLPTAACILLPKRRSRVLIGVACSRTLTQWMVCSSIREKKVTKMKRIDSVTGLASN